MISHICPWKDCIAVNRHGSSPGPFMCLSVKCDMTVYDRDASDCIPHTLLWNWVYYFSANGSAIRQCHVHSILECGMGWHSVQSRKDSWLQAAISRKSMPPLLTLEVPLIELLCHLCYTAWLLMADKTCTRIGALGNFALMGWHAEITGMKSAAVLSPHAVIAPQRLQQKVQLMSAPLLEKALAAPWRVSQQSRCIKF